MKVFMTGGTALWAPISPGNWSGLAMRSPSSAAGSSRCRAGARDQAGHRDPAQEGIGWGRRRSTTGLSTWPGPPSSAAGAPAYKQEIVESRIRTTRNLVIALAGGNRRQLLQHLGSGSITGPGEMRCSPRSRLRTPISWPGWGWTGEAEALKARELGLRVVITRFGIVLGKGGGALGQMAPMFRRFLGGPMGSGQQWFSWIHQADLARAFSFIGGIPKSTVR